VQANALGLINSFVDSGAFKVIVIANQKPFAEDEAYRSQKEKVIGRTLTVMSDPDAVLSEFADHLQDARAKIAVTKNRDDVLAVFHASGYHNLRSLRAALDDFNRLVEKADQRLAKSSTALRELLLYLLAICMEVRAGAAREQTLQELNDLVAYFNLPKELEATDARAIRSKYPLVNWDAPLISAVILGNLITTGVLPLSEIDAGLVVHPLIVGTALVPIWLSLWNWPRATKIEYETARAAILDQLTKRSVVHPGEILHVIGCLIALSEMDDNLVPNIDAYFRDYIDTLAKAGTLIPEIAVFEGPPIYSGWAHCGYHNHDDPTFKGLRIHLLHAVKALLQQQTIDEAKSLLASLSTPGSERALYEVDRADGKFGTVALLHNIAVGDFADVLVTDGMYNSQLSEALILRYDGARQHLDLLQEKDWILALETELRRRAATDRPPFSKNLGRHADRVFGKIRNAIEGIEQPQKIFRAHPPTPVTDAEPKGC
jgi:hypothetical protein